MAEGTTYRDIFEYSPDAILVMEGDRFVDCNPAAVRMLRFPNKADPERAGEILSAAVRAADLTRQLFETALRARGYRVLTAKDGQDALDRAAGYEGEIDLLLTDVVMPRVSGPELIRRLSTTAPGLKVLFMSGYSNEGDLGTSSTVETSSVLQKPFSLKVLHAEIRKILDEEPATRADEAT